MTQRRLFPDNPRICDETRRWAVKAKQAGASIWQIAVYLQRGRDSTYKIIRASESRHTRNSRKWRREILQACDTLPRSLMAKRYQPRTKKGRGSESAEPQPQLWRCPFCHGPSTDKEGHSACIARNPKAA